MDARTPSLIPLQYAVSQRSTTRRVLKFALLVVLVCIAIAVLQKRSELVDTITFLYRQQRCAGHQALADRVVYEEEPARAASLVEQRKARDLGDGRAAVIPSYWDALRVWHDGFLKPKAANLFLHERRSQNGLRRIIAVDLDCSSFSASGTRVSLTNHLWEPRWLPGPAGNGVGQDYILKRTGFSSFWIDRRPGDRIRFFAGQPDRDNPAKFKIPFEWRGTRSDLVGQLCDDGRLAYEIAPLPGTEFATVLKAKPSSTAAATP